MDGVTILNVIEVTTNSWGDFNNGAAVLALLITTFISAYVGFISKGDLEGLLLGCLVGALFCGIGSTECY